MKSRYIIAILLMVSIITEVKAQNSERDWDWEPYAYLEKGTTTFMVLYYGTRITGYDGMVRWKFQNKTAKPLFSIDLSDQIYVLENGDSVKLGGIDFKTRLLKPGKTAMTLPKVLEKESFSGIKEIKLSVPEIIVSFGAQGEFEWNKLGEVKFNEY